MQQCRHWPIRWTRDSVLASVETNPHDPSYDGPASRTLTLTPRALAEFAVAVF